LATARDIETGVENQFAVVDERATFVPFAKMQQSKEIVTFLPARAVSPHRPVCISSRN
jgi:hypothetical protein